MFRKKIFWRLYLSYLLIAMVAFAAIMLYAANAFDKVFIKTTSSELEHQARAIAFFIVNENGVSDRDEVDRISKESGKLFGSRITVVLPDGVVIGDSEDRPDLMENHAARSEIRSAMRNNTAVATRFSQTLKKEMVYVAVPLLSHGQIAGAVRASMPAKNILGIMHAFFIKILIEVMVIAVIVALLIFVISKRVIGRLEAIKLGAKKFRDGELSHRISVSGTDEIAEAAQTMNLMASELEDRIGRSKKLENIRKEFVANVSHELKTPVASIQGFAETLKDGAIKDPEKAIPYLNIITSHSNRLASIIEDLLHLSRIEELENKIELKEGEIKDVLGEAVSICSNKAFEKNISIVMNCEEGLTARINSILLEQAILNLLDNAIKYSVPGGTVNINASRVDENVSITVKDHGAGISSEHISRIFERFYRVDKGRSRKLGGTGLGLAIVKHVVGLHKGQISVESSIGKGSTFTILLPKV